MKLSEAIAKYEEALGSFTLWHLRSFPDLDGTPTLLLDVGQDSNKSRVNIRIRQVIRRGQAKFEPVEYAYPQEDQLHFEVFTWRSNRFEGPSRVGRFTGGID